MDKLVVEHRPALLSFAKNVGVLNNAAVVIKMGIGTKGSDQIYVHWPQSLEKLKDDWAKFTADVFSTLQEQLEEVDASEEPRNLDRDEESQDG
jgi:hypothetical protein